MKISIIIPTLNEAEKLPQLLDGILPYTYTYDEIIVVDGKSTDKTIEIASERGVKTITSNTQSRAYQMNLGAKHAAGDVFYFVHADTLPPKTFREDIERAYANGKEAGCYRFRFDKNNLMLRFNAWWTRFNFMFCRGGDQTLFITKNIFDELNGFDESYCIMEDFELIRRLKKKGEFFIIPKSVVVSARKYDKNSYFKVNMVNLWSYWMFQLGRSPKKIKTFYSRALNY